MEVYIWYNKYITNPHTISSCEKQETLVTSEVPTQLNPLQALRDLRPVRQRYSTRGIAMDDPFRVQGLQQVTASLSVAHTGTISAEIHGVHDLLLMMGTFSRDYSNKCNDLFHSTFCRCWLFMIVSVSRNKCSVMSLHMGLSIAGWWLYWWWLSKDARGVPPIYRSTQMCFEKSADPICQITGRWTECCTVNTAVQ